LPDISTSVTVVLVQVFRIYLIYATVKVIRTSYGTIVCAASLQVTLSLRRRPCVSPRTLSIACPIRLKTGLYNYASRGPQELTSLHTPRYIATLAIIADDIARRIRRLLPDNSVRAAARSAPSPRHNRR